MKNLLFLFLLFSMACGTTKTDTTLEQEDPKNEEVEPKKAVCESIEMDSRNYDAAPEDFYNLIAAKIENNCLAIDVSYSGGCGGATFKMFGQATIGKKPPPIVLLKLSLDDQDNCRGMVEKTLYFDLQDVQQQNYNEVSLQLKGLERQINYSYN